MEMQDILLGEAQCDNCEELLDNGELVIVMVAGRCSSNDDNSITFHPTGVVYACHADEVPIKDLCLPK